jgi:hypothetical protein
MAFVFLDFLLCNYFCMDTESGGKELVVHSIPGFSSVCNYCSVVTEPGGKELVANGVPGFSSI